MSKGQAERIYERYVGDYVNSKEFTKNGQIDEEAIEQQVEYATEQGWFDDSDVEPDDLREAIRTIASEDLA